MIISLSDKIYIDLESVRPILTDLVRAYTYQNPEFYSKQSMGFSVKNDSPIIEHYAIMDKNGKKFLVLPRGSLNKCLQIIKSKNPNTPIRLDDQRVIGKDIDVFLSADTTLESQQTQIIDLLSKNIGGLIEMEPGGGKSISALGLICKVKKKTLILVHEHRLRSQWEKEIKDRLKGDFTLGRYDGDKKIDGDICVGIINTVYNLYKLDKNFLAQFGVIIVDECFKGTAPVLTQYGYKKIKHISTNDRVLTINETSGTTEYKKVARRLKKDNKQNFVKIILANGQELLCTEYHKINTNSGWKEARCVTTNDLILGLNNDYTILHSMPKRNNKFFKIPNLPVQRNRKNFLLQGTRKRIQSKSASFWLCTINRNNKKEISYKNAFLRGLWKIRTIGYIAAKRFISRKKDIILLKRVQRYKQEKVVKRTYEETMSTARFSEDCKRQNADQQSYAKYRNCTKNDKNQEYKRNKCIQTSRGKWKTTTQRTSVTPRHFAIIKYFMDSRMRRAYQTEKRFWLSYLLQNRYWSKRFKNWNRGGWVNTRFSSTKTSGQKEDRVLSYVRVESVTFQESRNTRRFKWLRKKDYVYDLEIEDNHNYFVNGISVHNCHRVPSEMFTKVINNTPSLYRVGLTGTVKRKDGKHFLLFDSIGETLISIKPQHIKHRVTNFDYQVVNTDVKFQAPGVRRFVNGRSKSVVDFTKLLSVLVQSEKRNEVIINKITDSLKEQRVCLVISDRVEHCKLLYENILKKGFNVILLIGETRKETNWNEIREDKTIQCIIAQTSIAAEGLDYPILSALHLTCPSSNKPKLKQKIGRIRRQCEGKPFPMVYDYVDNEVYFDSDSNKPLLRGAQSRISYYKQLIAEYQKNLE